MDGYAVRSADCAAPGAVLRGSQRIPAGSVGTPLAAGTAARIFTGAHDPRRRRRGRDAGRHERAARGGRPGSVRIEIARRRPVDPPRRRRRRGAATSCWRTASASRPPALGLAASVGLDRLQVARAPARRAVVDRRRTRDARRGGARGDEARLDLQLQPLLHARAAAAAGLRGERPGHRARPARRDHRGAARAPPRRTT